MRKAAPTGKGGAVAPRTDPKAAEKEQLKKQILEELAGTIDTKILSQINEEVEKIEKQMAIKITEMETKAQELKTAVEAQQAKVVEESNKQAVSLKAQVLKIATALKAQSQSLRTQGENISEL